jgi:HK97 family phage portal protein
MNKLKILLDKFFGRKSVSLRDSLLFHDTFGNYYRTSQKYSSWVFDCMDIWGKHFAKVVFRLYEKNVGGSLSEVLTHPVLDIFSRPNEFQTWWEIKYRIAQHFSLYGNSYILKLRDAMNVPREMMQIHPSRIEPIASSKSYISHYEYFTGREKIKLEKSDIIHLRYPDPDNMIKGRAVIASVLDQSDVDLLQTAYQKKFYREGGFLGLTFSTEQELTEQSFERAKRELQQNYGNGLKNSFRVALFERGLQPVKAAYSIKDLDIKLQRELTRDEISAAFQVNQFLLGMGELINRATAETALFQFTNGVIEPLMFYIDDVFTKDLLHADFGTEYFIRHDPSPLRDMEADLKYYENGLKNGWLTVEEVRRWENL